MDYLSGLALDTSLLQCLVFTVTTVSSATKASWVIMYTMNNHTYNAMQNLTFNQLAKQSCLGAKDTIQSLLETLVGLQRSAVAIKSAEDVWDVLQCSKAVGKCGLH